MRTPIRPIRVLALAAIALATTAPAQAETTWCTPITSLPWTISAAGTYCLIGDLTTSISTGNAITINANSVTLDLNGHKLAGNAGAASTAVGIYATNRKYVVVRNGIVRGFHWAVRLLTDGSVANIIEDVTADGNWHVALQATGTGVIIRRNRAVNTGGTTVSANAAAFGIAIYGNGNTVAGNEITTVAGTGTGVGYAIYIAAQNTVAENNQIVNADVGVHVPGNNVLVSDNRFADLPLAMSFVGTGKYRNNLTTGVTTLATGGTDAGGND